MHCYSDRNRSDGPSRGKEIVPPSKPIPFWLSELLAGRPHQFDLVVAASKVSKNPARWLRMLLMLAGDIEPHPGPRKTIEDGAAEGAVAAEPVLLGRSEPDSEMAAGEAAGEPEVRVAPRELESGEEAREPRRQKLKVKKGDKRAPEIEVEELHAREQNRENPGGEASSSRGADQVDIDPQPPGPDASSGAGGVEGTEMNIGCLCAILRKARKEGVISEIFSPPRVAAQAQLVGMRPGFNFLWISKQREQMESTGI